MDDDTPTDGKSVDGDKYPVDSDRRRFVKGVVGGAALMGVGTTATAAVGSLTDDPGESGGGVRFYGVENVAGPAPRGMPIIPVEVVERDGREVLKGRWPSGYDEKRDLAVEEVGDVEYSSGWFQYCGVQTHPGIAPQADRENVFRYLDDAKYDWQTADTSGGDPVAVEDFADYEDWTNEFSTRGLGKPAAVTWRSDDGADPLPVEVIRSPRIEAIAESGDHPFLSAATDRGFLAHLNKCTHYCCVPGFATSDVSNEGVSSVGKVYCQCHQSIYDPFSVVSSSFVALPRPE